MTVPRVQKTAALAAYPCKNSVQTDEKYEDSNKWSRSKIYTQQLLHRRPQRNHNLRSSSIMSMQKPISRNQNKFKDGAFSIVVPKLWTNLLDVMRNSIPLDS